MRNPLFIALFGFVQSHVMRTRGDSWSHQRYSVKGLDFVFERVMMGWIRDSGEDADIAVERRRR
jgi:hypothetical protein